MSNPIITASEMTTELIIIAAIMVASVVVHFFFWRDSKQRYKVFIQQVKDLQEKLKQHEANDVEIDNKLDEAEADMERIGDEIDALRSVWFMKRKKVNIDS